MSMQATWRFVLKNVIPIFAAIITVSGVILVNTYFKPDLWYEEGSYYRSGDRAITSLRVQNYGHGDAEDIRVTVSFPDTILDVTSGEDANPFTIRSGGLGSKAVSGTISRLVPNESVYLYFAVKNPDGPIPSNYYNFVASNGIVYKGGMGKNGKPSKWLIAGLIIGISWSLTIVVLIFAYKGNAEGRRLLEKADKQIEEVKILQENNNKQQEELKALEAYADKLIEKLKTL